MWEQRNLTATTKRPILNTDRVIIMTDMTVEDMMTYEYEYNRWLDAMEDGGITWANDECASVALEQRLAEQEEYVAMIRQGQKTL